MRPHSIARSTKRSLIHIPTVKQQLSWSLLWERSSSSGGHHKPQTRCFFHRVQLCRCLRAIPTDVWARGEAGSLLAGTEEESRESVAPGRGQKPALCPHPKWWRNDGKRGLCLFPSEWDAGVRLHHNLCCSNTAFFCCAFSRVRSSCIISASYSEGEALPIADYLQLTAQMPIMILAAVSL